MMHGHEKSDPAIVAEKPANKAKKSTAEASAGKVAAEPVERRAGTKGNAGSSATAPRLPDADRRTWHTLDNGGQTGDIPGSDTIALAHIWTSTTAGRQLLACRCSKCCLRVNENSWPLRCLILRGSIPHPTQSLCT